MGDYDRLKVIVAGDTGVGKTALVHLLCYGEPLLNPSWTIGCNLELSIFTRSAGQSRGSDEERYFVEYWDVGGSANHENTRQVFYDNLHGIILVHDLTNKKSEANLSKWHTEITSKGRMGPLYERNLNKLRLEVVCQTTPNERLNTLVTSTPPNSIISPTFASPITSPSQQGSLGNTPPVLVVGTNLDQVRGLKRTPSASFLPSWNESSCRSGFSSGSRSFAASHRYPEITVNCNSSNSFTANSYNDNTLSAFLQQVVRFKRNNEGIGIRRDPMGDSNSPATYLTSLSNQNGFSMGNQGNHLYDRNFSGAVSCRMPNY